MGIVVDRFLQSEIESIGGGPAPDARDLAIRDALLGGIGVLLNTTEYDLDSSESGLSLLAACQTCDVSRQELRSFTLRNQSRSFARHEHPDVVASYADERRAETKDDPRPRAADHTAPATAANQVIAPIPESET